MSGEAYRLAIDLGAASGRAMLGQVDDGGLRVQELHRFHYGPERRDGHLRWDTDRLLGGIDAGLRSAVTVARGLRGTVASVGVCSWGIDYGLLDAEGRLLDEPIAYRDERTRGVMEVVLRRVRPEALYARTGIQFLPFNTLYQLAAHVRDGLPAAASRLLMIPDLCHHHLCGCEAGEVTNASTTQMWSVSGAGWDRETLGRLGIPSEILPEVVPSGTVLGSMRPEGHGGSGEVAVVAPATHDTASAVAGTPLREGWAYVSSGTWSLVGVELREPILSAAAFRQSFTNEAGAAGTVRFLKNVMGLWILESCRKEWDGSRPIGIEALLGQVSALPGFCGFVFVDDPRFLNPESMVETVRSCLRETGQNVPGSAAGLARVVLDSLALRYATVLDHIERLTGRPIAGVHVVGGGSQNHYLNQATANASGRPVLAGPVEATAIGNIVVQALAAGEIGSLAEGRRLGEILHAPRLYEPTDSVAWQEARERYSEIEPRVG